MVLHKRSTELVLQLLENDEWHYMKNIAKLTNLNSNKVKYITKFLAKYNLVKVDEGKHKVKLTTSSSKFLKKLRQLENEEKRLKTCK
jgi:predicted transcriptional regulator